MVWLRVANACGFWFPMCKTVVGAGTGAGTGIKGTGAPGMRDTGTGMGKITSLSNFLS